MSKLSVSKRKGERGALSIMACNSGKEFASRIVKSLNSKAIEPDQILDFRLIKSKEVYFANGEVKTLIEENIRGDDHYIIQCMDDPLI